MMASFKYLKKEILFDESHIQLLVVENKELFRNIISAFEFANPEELFVFSKDYVPFDFEKHGVYISNPLNTDTENKKILSKINSDLEDAANSEYYNEIMQIKQSLMNLADLLLRYNDFDFDCKYDIETASIIKLLDFRIKKDCLCHSEQLIRYILLVSKYLNRKLFVLPNMHLYFDSDELKLIYDTLLLNHIHVLVIEGIAPNESAECEQLYIVDNDLCELTDS